MTNEEVDRVLESIRHGNAERELELEERRGPERVEPGTLLLEVLGDHVPFLRTDNPTLAFSAAKTLEKAGELVTINLITAQ